VGALLTITLTGSTAIGRIVESPVTWLDLYYEEK